MQGLAGGIVDLDLDGLCIYHCQCNGSRSRWTLYLSLSMFGHLGKLAEELLGDDAVYIGETFEHFKLFVSHLQSSWKCSNKRNFDFSLSTCIPWLSASSRKLSRVTWPSFEALSYRSKRSKSRIHILKFPSSITRSFACLGFSSFPWQRSPLPRPSRG